MKVCVGGERRIDVLRLRILGIASLEGGKGIIRVAIPVCQTRSGREIVVVVALGNR